MTRQMYKAECDPKCGFLIRSHQREEVVDFLVRHANSVHQESFQAKDAEPLVKAIAA